MSSSKGTCLLVLGATLAHLASAQVTSYTVSTIAGGGLPSGTAATSVGLAFVYGVAADAAGNVYIAAQQQNRVYKVAVDGTLTIVAGNGAFGFSGDGGPAVVAQLSSPSSVAVDSTGNLYISDSANYRIRKVSVTGIITTVAGNGTPGFSGDGGLATAAQLNGAWSVAVDGNGILYIADSSNYRIRRVAGGIITTVAGNGIGGFAGDNGVATSAQLGYVRGLAVDTSGTNLYLGDGTNYRVRKVSGGVITTVAGTGAYGFAGDYGLAISANLTFIYDVAVDGGGNLYIADSSSGRIRKVTAGVITTVIGGGAGCAQQTDNVGDGCAPGNANLSAPSGVAVNSAGNLYVADTYHYRVRMVANGVITTIGGNGTYQYSGDSGLAANAQISPQAVAVRSPGNFYIADGPNYRIRSVAGGLITTAAGNGSCCYNGDSNVSATSVPVASATGVAADNSGNLYIAESTRVRQVSAGLINVFAGNGTSGLTGDGGPAVNAQLSAAVATAVDGSGNVYIADRNTNRVRKVSGGVITTVAGGAPPDGASATSVSLGLTIGVATDAAGNLYVPSASDHRVYRISTSGILTIVAGNGLPGFSGDNGSATAAQLNYPFGVAVNSAGTVVYIADRNNNRIRMVTGGIITTVVGGGGGCLQQTDSVGDGCAGTAATLSYPGKLALDAAGTTLYIADALNYRVRKLTGGVITTVAGTGSCCSVAGLGDGGFATGAQVNYATGIAVDPTNGDLYVGDSENFRVRKVSGGIITTVAGTGSYGYSGDGGAATSAQLTYAYGVAVDSAGNLYIADPANYRIRKVSGGIITTVAGTGSSAFSGDNGPATSAALNYPYDVALDNSGNLYIADTNNHRIRKVSGSTITTVGGNGLLSYSGDGGPATSGQLDGPSGVAVDGAGNLFIIDSNNYRVRRVSAGGVITTVAGNGTYGFSGEGAVATGPIGVPAGIAADSGGNVYFTDFSRVRRVSGGFINTIAGTGANGFSGDGGSALAASFSNPQGLAVDSAGNIYVADYGNSRIRVLTNSPRVINSIAPASVNAGATGFTLFVNGGVFSPGDTLQWNGTSLSTTFVNSGQLSAPISASQVSQIGLAAVTVNGISNAAGLSIVAPRLPPAVVSVSPASGNGTAQTFAFTVSDPAGAAAVNNIYVTINNGFGYASGCFFQYNRPTNTIWLANDVDSAWQGSSVVGSGGPVSNSQCTINGSSATTVSNGNSLTLNLPVTFKPAFVGAKNLYVYVDNNANLSSNWQNAGAWTIPGTPPSVISVNPPTGSGLSQTFALTVSDPAGASAINNVYVIANGSFGYGNSCFILYYRPANSFYLANDADSAWLGPVAVGSGGVLSNNQCTVTGAGASVVAGGNLLTVNLPVTFKPVFAGVKNIYVYTDDTANLNSGWQTPGMWIVPGSNQPPSVVSVTPTGGSALSQSFSFTVSDQAGAGAIADMYVMVNSSFGYANACFLFYSRSANTVWLANDADSAWQGSTVIGSGGAVSNSQCTITGAGASVALSGNLLTLTLPITFKAAFPGSKNIYIYADNTFNLSSGWQLGGAWTVPGTPPTVLSVSPASGSGSSQIFSVSVSDAAGANAIREIFALINGAFNYSSGCFLVYYRPANAIYLANDADSAWQGSTVVGSGGAISNSQCTVTGTGASVVAAGNQLTVNVPVTFTTAFSGSKNIYVYADDNPGFNSGWQTAASWTVPGPATPPAVVSLSPSSGSGSSQTFTFTLSDPAGGAAISSVYGIVAGTFSYASSCFFQYHRPSNTLWLANDADSAWQGSSAVGSGSPVSNSQCTLNGAGASVSVSGNQLTLNVPMTFKPSFAGPKNVYVYVDDIALQNSGWQTKGTWTAQ